MILFLPVTVNFPLINAAAVDGDADDIDTTSSSSSRTVSSYFPFLTTDVGHIDDVDDNDRGGTDNDDDYREIILANVVKF